MTELLLAEEGPVLRATMNRPERLNALSPGLIEALRELFVGLYWRRDIRVVVLEGAGRAFSAGLDLKGGTALPDASVTEALASQRRISEIVIAMRRSPQPIVALVDGPAAGGGFALALASDIRIATPRTRMNAAFIRIGLSACDIGVSYFLPRMVGASVAADYMLTGRFMDAQTALRLGLVSEVVTPEEIRAAGDRFVGQMLAATPLGLRLTKDALNHAIDMGSLEAVIAMEDRNQVLTARDANFAEGVAAFLEKRPPRYRPD
ncbi:enoyl-CoA hydratase/isomerase family protein [Thermaurantiacus tibetensis]|uniref:enoyl-CoA hydratase/isomerase family protein n=1 Tax=Thermaurantiacus tibetensis TaxID=2759035 RepID=UPI00189010F8|nr:enoyl-CoA hydratase-related protein [Thermaurantiacus tibetensis]